MTIHDAAPVQPTLLPDLLKARLPFLRRDTLKRVSDVVEALIQAQWFWQLNLSEAGVAQQVA